jgi:hypothetical protein
MLRLMLLRRLLRDSGLTIQILKKAEKMKKIILVVVSIIAAGCSSAPPTIQEGPDAEVSFDGLHLIDNSVFRQAWADPDIDFSRYTKFAPGGAFFEFRAVRNTGSSRVQATQTEFYIDDAARERLKEITEEIFREELANSTRFTETDVRGQDTIVVRGGLHDIVSNVPPQRATRGDVFLSSVGEITLVLEIVDSMSDEVIFRAVERRALEQGGGMAIRASSVTSQAEVRRLMRRWATRLREGLDSIPTE